MKLVNYLRVGILAALALVAGADGSAQSAPLPSWWTTGTNGVLDGTPADNWAAANIGQLKNIATQAKAHLDSVLGLTAQDWADAYPAPDASPFPFSTAPDPDNYSPVTAGQLKFVAAGFYRMLYAKVPGYDVRSRLLALGVSADSISGSGPVFPWSATVTAGDNMSMVTIGQLKIVFSFDLQSYVSPLPFSWQMQYFGHLGIDPEADPDNDGLTNLQEYQRGTDPTRPSFSSQDADTDTDNLSDAWEQRYFGTLLFDGDTQIGDMDRTALEDFQQGIAPIIITPVVATGLRTWYRADGLYYTADDSSNLVSRWVDMSGNGIHLDQTNGLAQPLAISDDGGVSTFDFSGPQRMDTARVDLMDGSAEFTIFAVIQPHAAQSSGATVFALSDGGAERLALRQNGSNLNQYELGWASALDQSPQGGAVTVTATAEATQLLTFTKAGTTQTAFLNGDAPVSATVAADFAATFGALSVGGTPIQANAGFNGHIQEVLIYNRALTTAERKSVEDDLLLRYQLDDLDHNGLSDRWERKNFGHTGVDPNADPDGDGLTNQQEQQLGLDPNNGDMDNDGWTDGQEIALGSDPTNATSVPSVSGVTFLTKISTNSSSATLYGPGPGLYGFSFSPTDTYKQLEINHQVSGAVSGNGSYTYSASLTDPSGGFDNEPTFSVQNNDPAFDFLTPTYLGFYWNVFGGLMDQSLEKAISYGHTDFATHADWTVTSDFTTNNVQYHQTDTFSVDLSDHAGQVVTQPSVTTNFSSGWALLAPVAETIHGAGGGLTVERSDYCIVVPAGAAGSIRWLEVFTPTDNAANQQFSPVKEWVIDGTKSPAFTLEAPASDGTVQIVLLPELAVDANRDGIIKTRMEDFSDATSDGKPYHFWLNDDIDSGDVANGSDSHDIPGQTAPLSSGFGPDYLTGDLASGLGDAGSVRGVRDLVDYFSVFLDIKQLLTALPPSDTVKYKLKQADGAVNFVYTNLTRASAFDYQRNLLTTGFGKALSQAPQGATKYHITATGVDLFSGIVGSSAFLDAIQNHDGGVILIDGRVATTQPLVLSVEKSDGTVIAEVKLELRISSVEQMFRHINLRDGADAASGLVGQQRDTGPATRLDNPVDAFPDTSTDQPWFIFVVGSNVGGQNARGWESEVFKRMYWGHSKARFVGVSWFGDPYSDGDDLLYDYHSAARNAFATAPALTAKINALPGSKTIAGHSAACLMISSAIADYGLSVNNACLIDAAMARECFDGSSADDLVGMVPAVWRDYPSSLWASHWYERFDSTDARSTLTWRNRFNGAAGVVHNFYSSTEDVLGRYEGTVDGSIIENVRAPGAFAWTIQEKAKGDKLRIGWFIHAGSDYGGWGFNLNDPLTINLPTWYVPNNNAQRVAKTPDQIGSVTTQMLSDIKIQPLFKTGWGRYFFGNPAVILVDTDPVNNTGPDWIFDLYGTTTANAIAADPAKRTQLLNEAIPALSLAVGANQTGSFPIVKQYDMPVQFADLATWPRGPKGTTNIPEWHHSDMREVAYFYLYKLYDKLSSLSNQRP